jgi:hypothetical protein
MFLGKIDFAIFLGGNKKFFLKKVINQKNKIKMPRVT